MKKQILYYTDNRCNTDIWLAVQNKLKSFNIPIVSVSLSPIDFGENIVFNGKRGRLTMFKQILMGLEKCTADVIFMAEHDVLYHKSHFDFVPKSKEVFYYNENRWRVDFETVKALFYLCGSTSGLCAYRDLLIKHYRKRVEQVEKHGYDHKLGYEPGITSHNIDDSTYELWKSEYPNIDIRHKDCLTESRWTRDKFRDKTTCLGWKEADDVPGWGITKNRMKVFIGENNG